MLLIDNSFIETIIVLGLHFSFQILKLDASFFYCLRDFIFLLHQLNMVLGCLFYLFQFIF